ncbi:MAG: methionyl-tRNA formyltransferase [Acidobacteria bacterium]|nr:methionyl-tRNA formyltransferase [Acidobacteriota bacterium]
MVKTVFFGTPGFAVPTLARLLASPHPVVAVVTRPDRPRGRGRRVSPSPVKSLAAEHGIPVLQPERLASDAVRQQIAAYEPDVAVVAAYGRILPDPLLETPRLGTFNVHASLLPEYRGAAPIQRAILAGETRTGVTIIRLVREMDAGPMLARRPLAIGPDATSSAVEQGLAELGADLLLEAVAEIEAGTATETPQDHAAATFAPRLTRDDGRIDWSRPARALHNQVRGLHPWPHAFTYLDGARYLILRSRIPEAGAGDGAGVVAGAADPAPGRLVEASGDRLVAAAGGGSVLAITEIQPEGRRPLPARAFLAGRRWTPGLRFDPAP